MWMQAGTMDKVTMSTLGMHGFDKAEDVWQLKWPPVSPSIKLATYKLSPRGES